MITGRLYRPMVLALALFASGCEKQTAVWIVPGSTASRLTFGLGKRDGREEAGRVGYLMVQRCGSFGDVSLRAWSVSSNGEASSPGLPGRVTYGETPSGFHAGGPARPLEPGRYVALTDGNGRATFEVNDVGQVRVTAGC